MNQAGAAVSSVPNKAGRGLYLLPGCLVHSAATLTLIVCFLCSEKCSTWIKMTDLPQGAKCLKEPRCFSVISYKFSSEERESFTDGKRSCSFRISICILNIERHCVVPVSLPMIWLENKWSPARQNSTGGTSAQTLACF